MRASRSRASPPFEVQRISGAVDGAAAAYEVQLRVWFTLLERMHW